MQDNCGVVVPGIVLATTRTPVMGFVITSVVLAVMLDALAESVHLGGFVAPKFPSRSSSVV